MTLKVYF